MDDIDKLVKWIKESSKTVFFGGAGVSTDSGMKDFRSRDGLYNEKYKYPPEVMLSHTFFMEHTEEFFKFYRDKLNPNGFKPNKTHYTLANMEKRHLLSSVITQNIDGFHEEAGSKRVINLHGTVKKNYCMDCGKFYKDEAVFNSTGIPRCSCGGIIKPDVVLYEEALNPIVINEAIEEISTCDLLIIGGTSLVVYPAASFIRYFKGKHLVLINNSSTQYDNMCDEVIHDNLALVFSEIDKKLF